MTEAEWLDFDLPYRSWPTLFTSAGEWLGPDEPLSQMIARLHEAGRPRQLQLFGCACCRRLWPLLEEAGMAAVEAVEGYVDGVVGAEDVRERMKEVELVPHLGWPDQSQRIAARAVAGLLTGVAAHHAAFAVADSTAERRAQYRLYLDVYGRPEPPPALDPAWLAWDRSFVANLAGQIHAEHRFADLPILGDALEDAGCSDEAILGHCRDGGPHVRGCWVLEMILDSPS